MARYETVLVSSTSMSLMQDPIIFRTGQNNDMTYLYPESTPSLPRLEVKRGQKPQGEAGGMHCFDVKALFPGP